MQVAEYREASDLVVCVEVVLIGKIQAVQDKIKEGPFLIIRHKAEPANRVFNLVHGEVGRHPVRLLLIDMLVPDDRLLDNRVIVIHLFVETLLVKH